MSTGAPDDPVELPVSGGRTLRWVVGAVVVMVALMQVAVGLQIGRLGPVIAGSVLVVLGAVVILGATRGTVVGRGGIHAPSRLRDRELPWSSITALRTGPTPSGRVQLLVERAGRPAEAAVRVATLRPAEADRLLPAIRAHASAHDVPIHDQR